VEAGTSQTVECEVRIAASPETIFNFFTDPVKAVQWMGHAATLDPRPGGIYRVDIDQGWIAIGEYVVVDPPHRVVFTWGWKDDADLVPPGSSTVEITLTPDGEETIVRLVHSDLPTPESAAGHRAGWEKFLPRLAIVAAETNKED
jgi:uncharacterized protein YndB with AHSA1/START domain